MKNRKSMRPLFTLDEILLYSGLSEHEKNIMQGIFPRYEDENALREDREREASLNSQLARYRSEVIFKEGITCKEMCELFGMKYHTLLKWIRKKWVSPFLQPYPNPHYVFERREVDRVRNLIETITRGVPFTTV